MQTILIIEPSDPVRKMLAERFKKEGYEVITTHDYLSAQSMMKATPPALVIADINEENTDPFEVLKKLQSEDRPIKVIATAALASMETAVQAMKHEATDFLLKPFSVEELIIKANQLLKSQDTAIAGQSSSAQSSTKIIGKSAAITNLINLVSKIAKTDKAVLISGDSGTGKTLIATTVHEWSDRAEKPLLSINCSAFSEEIYLESELFGFAKGAFDGANVPREGAFVKAGNGTLILEEVRDLPLKTQAKILQYLQTGEIRRLGENTPITTNTRIIATTRKDLGASVTKGTFRTDLQFRLKNIYLKVPPLSKRGEDIPLLIKHYLKKYHKRGGPHYKMDKEAISTLCSLPYPGNVRELRNIIEQVLLISESEVIDKATLERADISSTPEEKGALKKMALTEKEIISQVVKKHPRDLDSAAKELGVSRTTLWRRMKKYNMVHTSN